MRPPPPLGQLEQLVLAAILMLEEGAYGVTIHREVARLSAPRPVSIGAVYVTLDRLEDKGLTRSWRSDPTPERGGRAKRCFQLEPLGERALRDAGETARRMHETISRTWRPRRWTHA